MLDKTFDSRLIKRKIAKGLITQEDYDAYITNLPDAAKKSVAVSVPQPDKATHGDDDESLD